MNPKCSILISSAILIGPEVINIDHSAQFAARDSSRNIFSKRALNRLANTAFLNLPRRFSFPALTIDCLAARG